MKKILTTIMAFLPTLALAAATVTVTQGPWDLYRGTSKVSTHDTEVKCIEAAKALNVTRAYTCRTRTGVSVTVTADPLPPIDCAGAWSDWAPTSNWSACANGSQSRTEARAFAVTTPPANGGAACPASPETRTVSQPCEVPPDPPPPGDAIIVNPGESISAATARLQPGGTVVVRPGTYAAFSLKACTAAAWCTVKAETDGTVIVTGLSLGTGNWYTSVEGFKFTGSSGKRILGSSVKFKRNAFEGGPATGNEVSLQIGSSEASAKDVLVEDSWVYGKGGRYKVLVYNSERVVLRRVLVRHDGGWAYDSRNPQGGFSLYDSRDVSCQDCMFLDPATGLNGFEAALYLVSNGTTPIRQSNVSVLGAVLRDSPNNGLAAEGNGAAATYSVWDVFVKGSREGALNTNNSGHTLSAVRVHCDVSGTCFGKWASGGALRVNGCTVARGSLSSGASLSNCPNGAGPVLDSRIGQSGTLFGEPGFDTLTAEPLWPWPNEARIKADFDSVRPFCGGKTVTECARP